MSSPISGKNYPLWHRFVEYKNEWIGGVLEETTDGICPDRTTEIVDISFEKGSEWSGTPRTFCIHGKTFSKTFNTDYSNLQVNPQSPWIRFHVSYTPDFRIMKRDINKYPAPYYGELKLGSGKKTGPVHPRYLNMNTTDGVIRYVKWLLRSSVYEEKDYTISAESISINLCYDGRSNQAYLVGLLREKFGEAVKVKGSRVTVIFSKCKEKPPENKKSQFTKGFNVNDQRQKT